MDEQYFEVNASTSSMPSFVYDALKYSLEQIQLTLTAITNFPELTDNGKWVSVDDGNDGGWTGAHWTGLLWLAFVHKQDETLLKAALEWTQRLAPRQHDTFTHDLGFLFELSFLLGSRITGDNALKQPVLQAAKTLTKRFNPKGQFIQAWGALDGSAEERGRSIIDTMMNLDLLFWASTETGDKRYAEIANQCASIALKHHVRADWSTSHVTDFNPDTGQFIKQDTHQGDSATSCWARGQAWSIYGFAECYRETGNETFLDTSRNLADYFLSRLPDDLIPYWDFDSPLIPDDVRDSSASAIAASALLLLATLDPDTAKRTYWREQGIVLLAALWNKYSSRQTNEPSILIHGTRHKPHGFVDSGLIYGDYYFVEALTRILKPKMLL